MNQIEMVKIMKKIQKDRKRIIKISKGEQNERRKKGRKKETEWIYIYVKGKQKERRKMMEIKMNKINTKILSE